MDNIEQCYEMERLFIINSECEFVYIKNKLFPDQYDKRNISIYRQKRVYLDTNDLKLFNVGTYISISPYGNGSSIKIIKKDNFFTFLSHKDIVKKESVFPIISIGNLFPKAFIQDILSMNVKFSELHPMIIIEQVRYHKVIKQSNYSVYLSVDEVFFICPVTRKEKKSYMVEIEMSEKNMSDLSEKYFCDFISDNFSQYNLVSIEPSKAKYGYSLLKEIL